MFAAFFLALVPGLILLVIGAFAFESGWFVVVGVAVLVIGLVVSRVFRAGGSA